MTFLKKNWFRLILAALTVALLYYTYNTWVHSESFMTKRFPMPAKDPSHWGDIFTGLNALFAGFAFIGIIVTVVVQAIANHDQKISSNQQALESTFFNMLSVHENIVNTMRYRFNSGENQNEVDGRESFTVYYLELKKYYLADRHECKILAKPLGKEKNESEYVNYVFGKLFKAQTANLSHYFRFLYHIIKTIENSSISEQDKKKYVNIVRAILSSYEQLLLFYNGTWYRTGKFYPLIVKYQLLENMDTALLLDPSHMNKEFYPSVAYGNAD